MSKNKINNCQKNEFDCHKLSDYFLAAVCGRKGGVRHVAGEIANPTTQGRQRQSSSISQRLRRDGAREGIRDAEDCTAAAMDYGL
jgi:hypothetical protein